MKIGSPAKASAWSGERNAIVSSIPLVLGGAGMGSRVGTHGDGTRGVDVATE